MTSGVDDAERPVDNNLLHELRADARIEFIDNVHQQQAGLQRLRPPPSSNGSAGFASASSASAWDVPSPTPLRHKACAELRLTDFDDDYLGHTAGDWFIRVLADRLREGAEGPNLIARLGGDEFVVVPAVPMDADTAEALAFGFSQYCASGWPSTEKC